jgi:hypothetical protein
MEEEFIDLDNLINLIKEQSEIKLYQIQITNNTFIFKHIGETNEKAPEVIIKENFGIDNKYSMFTMIYEENELKEYNKKIIPLIRITNNINNYSICIKYNVDNIYNTNDVFDLYFVYNINNQIMHKILEKNINSDNIIEKLFEFIIDTGIILFDKNS